MLYGKATTLIGRRSFQFGFFINKLIPHLPIVDKRNLDYFPLICIHDHGKMTIVMNKEIKWK